MTTEKINNGLIEIMREKIPAGTNLARILMDLLCIGKEAVYRRLRGEVPFTLAEAAVVSGKLGISLDKLVGSDSTGNAVFDLNIVKQENPVDTYCTMLDNYAQFFHSVLSEDDSECGSACNIIPQIFSMNYEFLSKFRLVKWMYQHHNSDQSLSFDDVIIPDRVNRKQAEYVRELQNINFSYFVLDSMIFSSLVNDIKYFESINMIDHTHIKRLKEELIALIEEMSTISTTGCFRTGKKVQLYISNINFEATYSYVESRHFQLSMLRIFSINSMTSKDGEVFRNLKDWISSMKKFSILISQSGEMHRIQFFNRQREIVNTL